MPFVTFDQIKKRLPTGLHALLGKPEVFAEMEAAAAIIVRDKTGSTVPDDPADAPDWVAQPMVWLIAKAAESLVKFDEQERRTIAENYTLALTLLAGYRTKPTASQSTIGGRKEIAGEVTW